MTQLSSRPIQPASISKMETARSSETLVPDYTHDTKLQYLKPLNRNEYHESLKIKKPGGKVRPARRAENLAGIY
jgi:hypothetical protein